MTKMQIKDYIMSDLQKKTFGGENYHQAPSKEKKSQEKKYVVHFQNLQLCQSMGMQIKNLRVIYLVIFDTVIIITILF